MAERTARPSTDEEAAPLLTQPGETAHDAPPPTLSQRVGSAAQEPLTPLTKILLILALVLLLTSSIFIGLFAGAQHRLGLGNGNPGDGGEDHTSTRTLTSATTAISTTILTSTRTKTRTKTETTIATTTAKPIPVPVPTNPSEKLCLTPQCIKLSASVLSSLHTEQDPCESFFDFATGGWLKAHPIPADKQSAGVMETLFDENGKVIRRILESNQLLDDKSDQRIVRKLKDLYSSCLNEEDIDKLGISPLLQIVRRLRTFFKEEDTDLATSSVDDDVGKKRKMLTDALAFVHQIGVPSFFTFNVEGDIGVDPDTMVLWFSQPALGLPSKEYYEEPEIKKLYLTVVEQLLLAVDDEVESEGPAHEKQVLTPNREPSVWPPWPWPPWDGDGDGDGGDGENPKNRSERIRKLAKNVVQLDVRIAQATLDPLDFVDPIRTYNPLPMRNLTETIPQIDFRAYISAMTTEDLPNHLVVVDPTYAREISGIFEETPVSVIEAYLVARTALTFSPYLGKRTDAWQAQRSLAEVLTGVKKGAEGDRSEYCINRVQDMMGFATGRYFVNETFTEDSKKKAGTVMKNVINAFKYSLEDLDWMDRKSAIAAAEKADNIRIKVGYPVSPDTLDPKSIEVYYQDLEISNGKFLLNIKAGKMFAETKKWSRLGHRRDPGEWEMYPAIVNAYFNPPANEIIFPAGILQPPFFSAGWPGYMTYGGFGGAASHELTHAFDSIGRQYNQHGKLEQWWTNATSQGYQIKEDCIIKQYSEYTIDDGKGGKIHVNGNMTAMENIGDSGFIQAYRAWKQQYHISLAEGNELLLPGLEFTREQLFFISLARTFARVLSPAAAIEHIRTDYHSPAKYRVDGTFSNMPEFARAFKCPKNSKMNPSREKQCIFWS